MKKKSDNHGFVMVEAMVIVMIFTLLASTLYSLAEMKHRMAIRRVQEDEAYYAAVCAVRLLAEELGDGEYEERISNGIELLGTEITFVPDDSDGEMVSVPVEVWTERSGDELLLGAKAEYGTREKKVTLLLCLTESEIRILEDTENRVGIATVSDAYSKCVYNWVPVHYQVEE